MSANFTPDKNTLTPLKPFRFWCQQILPLTYDDSLSYYELLCKVVDALNKSMEDIELLSADVDNMFTAFNELQDYINHYFDDLDVQTAINNKLDAMAAAGYFSDLFNTLFRSDIMETAADVAGDWIAANLIQEPGYVIDTSLLVSGAAADAKATGDKIREITSELLVSYELSSEIVISELVTGERYVSTGIQTNADYKRAKYLYPIKPFQCLHCEETEIGDEMAINFFDDSLTWITRRYIFNENDLNPSCVAPKNAAYIGFDVKTINTDTAFKLYLIGDGKCNNIDRTFSDNLKSYLVEPNRVITTNGNKNTSTNYDVLVLPNPNADTMYCSFNVGSNAYAMDSDGNMSFLTATTVPGEDYARRYTIPDNCKLLFISFPKALQLNEDGLNMSYVNMIRETDNPINNKKIMCIGASATRMDQHSVAASGSTGGFVGWQKWLKWQGAFCTNKGFDGYCYATGYGSGSLYTAIVTNAVDVTKEDIIILMGGQNDAQYTAPIGTPPNNYGSIDTNPATMCGAINGIMNYIKTNNPDCKVYIVTQYKSSLSSLGFSKVKQYVDAIKSCAEFWSAPVIDLFEECDFTPGVNSSYYLYDGIHPNTKGAENIGKTIAAHIMASQLK